MIDLTVKLKSEDGSRKYSKQFLVYDVVELNTPGDEGLQVYISETMKEWGDEKPDEVLVQIKKHMI